MKSTLVDQNNNTPTQKACYHNPSASEGSQPSCSFRSADLCPLINQSRLMLGCTPVRADSPVVKTLPLQGRDRKFKSFSAHRGAHPRLCNPLVPCWPTSTPVHSREVHNGNRKLATLSNQLPSYLPTIRDRS